ncbi:McrB family protein [Clostridium tyrobutyricum]|uniref:McrB family protein n=1 Tax=Clostridium tyrobutyricum TaxID=1519 RepID=UPI000AEAB46B|nr:AAA family ATPase [Clostridium tyrobutyricum]
MQKEITLKYGDKSQKVDYYNNISYKIRENSTRFEEIVVNGTPIECNSNSITLKGMVQLIELFKISTAEFVDYSYMFKNSVKNIYRLVNRMFFYPNVEAMQEKAESFLSINNAERNKIKNKNKHVSVNGNDFYYHINAIADYFSLLVGVLNKYGKEQDEIVIKYEQRELETSENNLESDQMGMTYQNKYSRSVIDAKNVIFRGAPGTGKTFLANEIAADIISNGRTTHVKELTEDEKRRIGFVQFHPSYDYTDFVEGLRPITTEDGVVSFKLKSGSFKSFVEKALEIKAVGGQDNFDEAWDKFFESVSEACSEGSGYNELRTLTGKPVKDLLAYERNEMQGVYLAGTMTCLTHDQIYNVYRGLPGTPKGGFDSYRKSIVKQLKSRFDLKDYIPATKSTSNGEKYVFIIDEINRGEVSKIFGELFFSIDPCYRGNKDGVFTQYANLHKNPEEKFYVPKNVYIIGTMNDIDRSVDTFDFAMRRRFTFLEITAEDSQKMLNSDKTKAVMTRLNEAIVEKEKGGLTIDYQIGASYFKSIDKLGVDREFFESLWNTKLKPLLKDYFRGEHKSDEKLAKLEKIYFDEVDNND